MNILTPIKVALLSKLINKVSPPSSEIENPYKEPSIQTKKISDSLLKSEIKTFVFKTNDIESTYNFKESLHTDLFNNNHLKNTISLEDIDTIPFIAIPSSHNKFSTCHFYSLSQLKKNGWKNPLTNLKLSLAVFRLIINHLSHIVFL